MKIDGGSIGVVWTPVAVVEPLWKSARMGLESQFWTIQLNNSLANSAFRYFTFSGENIKIQPYLEKCDSPWKSSFFTLPYGLTFNGVRGTRLISWSEDPWIYIDGKHDEAILIMFEHFEWIRPFPLLSWVYLDILWNLLHHGWWM